MNSPNEDYFVLKVPDSFFVYTDEKIPDGKPIQTDITVRYKEAEPYGLFTIFPMVIFDGPLLVRGIINLAILRKQIPHVKSVDAEVVVGNESQKYSKIHFNKFHSVIDFEKSDLESNGNIVSFANKLVLCPNKIEQIPEEERVIMMMKECPNVILFSKGFIDFISDYNKRLYDEESFSDRYFSFIPLSEFTFGV